jgi:cytosine/uracil/thiamine/allantoin permease
MGRVTIIGTVLATICFLVTFGKGMLVVHGGADTMSHLYWAAATLVLVLSANVIAIVHAARSDRLIAELRDALEAERAAHRPEGH